MRLVLLPGLACDAALWRDVQPALPPLPGGVTVSDAHQHGGSIADMAARLLAAQAGDLLLAGASMGAMVAMEAARQAPQRVRALALLGVNARAESDDMRRLREEAIALFAQGRLREVLAANVPLAFAPAHAARADWVQDYFAMVERAGAQQLIAQNRAVIGRPDARDVLAGFAGPVLVVCGEDDALTPPDLAREAAALAPRARLALLPQCGHMLTWEQPAQVAALLTGWLREAGAPV